MWKLNFIWEDLLPNASEFFIPEEFGLFYINMLPAYSTRVRIYCNAHYAR